jgi:hypothetical protein
MHDAKTVRNLAGAASYLSVAAEELAAAGFDAWGEEVKHLLDIIAAEIAWLETESSKRLA